MHWTDQAIVLSAKKYGESSAIVTLLTAEHGIFKGLVRGISGKKQRGIYQTGNLIEAIWRGRLSEHLGNFTAELESANAAMLLSSSSKLSALLSISSILESVLPEREPHMDVFEHLVDFIEHLTEDKNWPLYYVAMEFKLLNLLGFGIDVSSCAATGAVEDLIYISPKSGRAVSRTAGDPYRDRLFAMPKFLTNGYNSDIKMHEIINAMNICSYFLEKYRFKPHNASLPDARLRFAEIMKKKEVV